MASATRQLLRERRKRDVPLALGQRGHEIRLELRQYDYVTHIEPREHEAGEEGAGVELHHRHAGGGAIDDQQDRGRDHDTETAARGDRPGRHRNVVARLQHGRQREQAHQRHHRADDAGGRREHRAGDDGGHGQRARHIGHGEMQALEQPVDQRGALDQVTHEHEQRHGDQHVVRHHAIGALHHEIEDLLHRQIGVDAAIRQPGEEHAHAHEREGRGKPEHDGHHDQGQHDQPEVAVGDVAPGREHDHRADDDRHQRKTEPEFLAQPHGRGPLCVASSSSF